MTFLFTDVVDTEGVKVETLLTPGFLEFITLFDINLLLSVIYFNFLDFRLRNLELQRP